MTRSIDSNPAWLPYARLNLYRNPFGELAPEERAELASLDTAPWVELLRQRRTAVQFIGGCGRGKTTRMLRLRRELPESRYVYLPEDGPCPVIAEGDPIMIDEAQRLPRRARKSVFAAGNALVLATHRDLRRILVRYGYRCRTFRIGPDNSPDLIREVMNRRIEASRLHDGPTLTLSHTEAVKLSQRFGTDLRSMENYLYERLQQQLENNGQVRFVD